MHQLGQTRSTTQATHSLHTPDAFVRTTLPGMERAAAVVHASPALGAGFLQYTAELEVDGRLGPTQHQRFVYVVSGEVVAVVDGQSRVLSPGGYVYLPSAEPMPTCDLFAPREAKLAVIEKAYQPLSGTPAPGAFIGEEKDATPQPLGGDADLLVRSLLPADVAFDFAVNTMTYEPGAALAMVEAHVMEHGLMMLEGGGIYRLGDNWYAVQAGDFIWMAAYCPQWFGAIGKVPAKYLIYKDWNRSPAL